MCGACWCSDDELRATRERERLPTAQRGLCWAANTTMQDEELPKLAASLRHPGQPQWTLSTPMPAPEAPRIPPSPSPSPIALILPPIPMACESLDAASCRLLLTIKQLRREDERRRRCESDERRRHEHRNTVKQGEQALQARTQQRGIDRSVEARATSANHARRGTRPSVRVRVGIARQGSVQYSGLPAGRLSVRRSGAG